MIPKSSYRLSEYKIIEDENGALWWEAHAGFGGLKRGKCFLMGDILFIGESKIEEPGFLKTEFLEKLKPLPEWGKTKYYCLSNDIRTSKSSRRLTEEEMQSWGKGRFGSEEKTDLPRAPDKKEYQSEGSDRPEEVSYKLGKYEIVEKTDGQLWWKTHSSYNTLKVGKCIVAEDILFIGMGEDEESGSLKNEFLDYLKHLPEWSATKYYCPNYALYDCRTGNKLTHKEKIGRPKKGLRREKPDNRVGDPMGRKIKGGKSDLTKWIDIIHRNSFKKWIAYIAALFLMISALILAILIGFWHNKTNHHREKSHQSNHHR